MAPSIILELGTRRRFASQLRQSGRREIGGILFGEQLAPGQFRLVDFSVDDATGSAAHFCRTTEQHSKELESFFERTGREFAKYNYLGEWHSHPSFPVEPSAQDSRSMSELVHGETNIGFAALLIVRLDFLLFLRVGAVMFSRNNAPEQIRIIRR